VGNFPRVLALMCVLFWALETRAEGTDVFGGFRLLLGMLLCVGCLVFKAYPTGF
jgi:hypothetical protein